MHHNILRCAFTGAVCAITLQPINCAPPLLRTRCCLSRDHQIKKQCSASGTGMQGLGSIHKWVAGMLHTAWLQLSVLALLHVQAKLVRAGTSMNAPDTPAVQPLETTPRVARQRKRKEIEVVDERSERMQKRMVSHCTGLLCGSRCGTGARVCVELGMRIWASLLRLKGLNADYQAASP